MKKEKMEHVLDLLKGEKDEVSEMICSILRNFENEKNIEDEEVLDKELVWSSEYTDFSVDVLDLMRYKTFNKAVRTFVALWKQKIAMEESDVAIMPDDNKLTEEEAREWMDKGMPLDELIDCLKEPNERKEIYAHTGLMYKDIDNIVDVLEKEQRRMVVNQIAIDGEKVTGNLAAPEECDKELMWSVESAEYMAKLTKKMGYKSFNDNLRKFVALWDERKDLLIEILDVIQKENSIS